MGFLWWWWCLLWFGEHCYLKRKPATRKTGGGKSVHREWPKWSEIPMGSTYGTDETRIEWLVHQRTRRFGHCQRTVRHTLRLCLGAWLDGPPSLARRRYPLHWSQRLIIRRLCQVCFLYGIRSFCFSTMVSNALLFCTSGNSSDHSCALKLVPCVDEDKVLTFIV